MSGTFPDKMLVQENMRSTRKLVRLSALLDLLSEPQVNKAVLRSHPGF